MKTVWKFTNGRELTKSEFVNYFERKVFRTIRQHTLLPKNKIFILKKSTSLNTMVLKYILETKFEVKLSSSPNISTSTLSDEAENIFKNITKGKFDYTPQLSPFSNLTNKEIQLYAKLKNIKGDLKEENKKIQSLFKKFLQKNQDLEINILNAQNQISKTD